MANTESKPRYLIPPILTEKQRADIVDALDTLREQKRPIIGGLKPSPANLIARSNDRIAQLEERVARIEAMIEDLIRSAA